MKQTVDSCPRARRKYSFARYFSSPSIRIALGLLVVACVLPIAIVAAFLIVNYYEREQIRLASNAIIQARTIVSTVDRDIISTQAALLALGTSHQLAIGNLEDFHARAIEALKNINADSIVVLDLTGQLLLSTRRPYGEPLGKVPNPGLLRRILETGKPSVSNLFMGPMVNRIIYTIAVPIRREGVILYSMNATVTTNKLMNVLTNQNFSESWISVVTDSTGTIAARSHEEEKFSGKKVVPDLLKRMKETNEGSFETITLEGIPVLTAFSCSPDTNWMAAIGIPRNELTAGLRQSLFLLVTASLGALALGLWLAWLIGGRIAKSIAALTQPAIELALGEMPTIPPLQFREANEMRQALMNTAVSLRKTRFEASHDSLTGLANRTLFHLTLSQQLALCRRNNTEVCVLYIDLDGFKAVNDTHGHAAGDRILCNVADRIKGAIRDSDFAARLGGDEFAIGLVYTGLTYAAEFAAHLIESISVPYRLGEIEVKVSASIGVAAYPSSADDVDTLLQQADRAMYKAKSSGKRRVCLAIT